MGTIELTEYLQPLRKWWWLLLASTIIAAGSALAYLSMQTPLYESRTTLMVGSGVSDSNPDASTLYTQQQLADTYADMARRSTVQQKTAEALNLGWLPFYDVRVVANSPILEIRVVDEVPERAQTVATELVTQLRNLSPGNKQSEDRRIFVEEQLRNLETSIRETEADITSKEQNLQNLNSARDIASVRNEIGALNQKLIDLRARYTDFLSNSQRGAVNQLNVLEPASLPGGPIDTQLPLNVVVAAMVGFALAAGAAYLMEYLDNTIKTADQVKRDLNLPTLGAIPLISKVGTADSKLVMLNSRQNGTSEAFHVLRTNLQFASVDRPLGLVLVTSPSPAEGKSLTSANLSVALARSGKRVILVDTDLHRPNQHQIFRLINHSGLTNALLSDSSKIEGLLQNTVIDNLRLLTTGPLPPNPSEILSTKRMQEILTQLRGMADIVILDSPPVTVVADTAQIATYADGVVLVLNAQKTTRDAAKRALGALTQVKAHMLGVLLNGVSEKNPGYHYYYYATYDNNYSRKDASGKSESGKSGGKSSKSSAQAQLTYSGNAGAAASATSTAIDTTGRSVAATGD